MKLTPTQQHKTDHIIQASTNPLKLIQIPPRPATQEDLKIINTYHTGTPSPKQEEAAVILHRQVKTHYHKNALQLTSVELYTKLTTSTPWEKETYHKEISHRIEKSVLTSPSPTLDGEKLYPHPTTKEIHQTIRKLLNHPDK